MFSISDITFLKGINSFTEEIYIYIYTFNLWDSEDGILGRWFFTLQGLCLPGCFVVILLASVVPIRVSCRVTLGYLFTFQGVILNAD